MCRKNTESENPKVVRTKNGRTMFLSSCSGCNSKTSKILKEQEAIGLLISLGIRTPFTQILFLGLILFQKHKMNEKINKFN